MKLVWLIALLLFVLSISLLYQVTIHEPLTDEEMTKAVTYDMRKDNEKDEIQSVPEIARFTVLLEDLHKNNNIDSSASKEFSKKNNAIIYTMGCVLEKQTDESIQKSEEIKANEIKDIKLPMETNKLNSYIALSPKDGKYFPTSFRLKVTNKVDVNKYNYELWGTSPGTEGAPSNGIINANNIKSFPYPDDLYTIKNKNLVIGNIDIGTKALNILSIGNIFDENFNVIGNVDSINNDIIINCDNGDNITGLLIYIGAPLPIQ